MTIRNLSPLLHAGSIAVVGGSARTGSLGAIVLDNILASGFPGRVQVVNTRTVERPGVEWVASVAALGPAPDLAIVVTPAATVPAIVADLGRLGTKCAVIVSAGLTDASGLKRPMLEAAAAHGMRIVGPNCLGIAAPHVPLDATFARTRAAPGGLALISQSGALVTGVLDWAQARGIGFSGVVSAGDMADVDLGDLVDLFADDPRTDAILIYLEGVTDAPEFLAAARAAARRKPVIAIKAGKSPLAARATLSHTGALAGSYDVYRAAFERAGIVVVETLTALFDAAAILCAARPACGDRLGIVTNGGGAGILAIDALGAAQAQLASLETTTIDALTAALPAGWSHGNPVDVLGDAGPDRYRAAVRAVLRDPGVDALLLMNCPTGQYDAVDIATAISDEVEAARADHIVKPVLACGLGEASAAAVREARGGPSTPVYPPPHEAVRGFGYLLAARRARLSLTDSLAATRSFATDAAAARAIIATARAEGRTLLSEIEAKDVLAAYGIPVARTRFAQTAALAGAACASLRAPYALKIVSPDISQDATFGPVLLAGTGGTAVEVIGDKALALPPIDHAQAQALVHATAISRLLAGYRNVPPADIDAVAGVLDGLSAMTVDLPDIVELDINPLLVDTQGVIGLDARIRISAEPQTRSRLALRPPPLQWSADLATRSGTRIHVRAVRADDEPALARFFEKVSPEDLRFRFMTGLARVDHERLVTMTRVDYWRTISFLALEDSGDIVATAMLATDPDRTRAEVALVTRSDMKGKGVSWALFEHVLRYAQAEGIGTVEALECADHEAALQMERELGFTTCVDPDDSTVRIARRVFAGQEPS